MEAFVVKKDAAETFYEGDEFCRRYYESERITLGMSILEPGKTGAIDWGHVDATEVFFVVKGKVILRTPVSAVNAEAKYEMEEGDAIVIPEEVPHELTNIGDETAIVSWSLGPGMPETPAH